MRRTRPVGPVDRISLLHPAYFCADSHAPLSPCPVNGGTVPSPTGIQALLDEPNEGDPAQLEPYKLYKESREEYRKRVRQQALEMTPRE